MSAIPVPTVNINALYTNTTSGTDADPQVMDNAIIDIVNTINANASEQNTNTAAAVLPHADGSVTTAKLADLGTTTAKLAASAVTTAKLADANVTTAKLADSSVTLAKMADSSVGTTELVDLAVTRPKIAVGAVGASQLDPTLLTDFGDIAVQAEFDRRVGLDVTKFGVVGDGIHDDTAAFRLAGAAAIALRTTLIFPADRRFLITDECEFNEAFIMVGLGMEQGNGGSSTVKGSFFIFSNNDVDGGGNATKCFIRFKKMLGYRLNAMRMSGLGIIHTSTVKNQHSIIIDGADFSYSRLDRLSFIGCTGYGIQFSGATYSQNMSWLNLSFYNVGGCIGRSSTAAALIVTLGILENLNLDSGINPISPQTDVWNLKGWRSLEINTMLTEGALTAGAYTINGLTLGGETVVANNLWFEFSSTKKLTNAILIDAAGNYRISQVTGIIEASPLRVNTGIMAVVKVTNAECYTGSIGNMFINSSLSSIEVDGIRQSDITVVPEISTGKLSVKNMSSANSVNLVTVDQPSEIILGEYSGGAFQKNMYLDFLDNASRVASLSIVNDPFGEEGRVLKITATDFQLPTVGIAATIPTKYAGANLIMAIRYYIETSDTTCSDILMAALTTFGTNFVRTGGNVKNMWSTAYVTINNVASGLIKTYGQTINSDGVHPNTLYVSAIRLIVGRSLPSIRGKCGITQNVTTYGTAIPTIGQWLKGDRIYNSNPTVGQPKSWVCTVSGTPGTWVSEGNL